MHARTDASCTAQCTYKLAWCVHAANLLWGHHVVVVVAWGCCMLSENERDVEHEHRTHSPRATSIEHANASSIEGRWRGERPPAGVGPTGWGACPEALLLRRWLLGQLVGKFALAAPYARSSERLLRRGRDRQWRLEGERRPQVLLCRRGSTMPMCEPQRMSISEASSGCMRISALYGAPS